MKQIRIMKNRTRIGRAWLVVRGDYYARDQIAANMGLERARWKTEFQIGDFDLLKDAKAAKEEADAKAKP